MINGAIVYFAKRAFSDVLEGIASENYSGGKPPDPHFSKACLSNRTIMGNIFLPIEADMEHINAPGS